MLGVGLGLGVGEGVRNRVRVRVRWARAPGLEHVVGALVTPLVEQEEQGLVRVRVSVRVRVGVRARVRVRVRVSSSRRGGAPPRAGRCREIAGDVGR